MLSSVISACAPTYLSQICYSAPSQSPGCCFRELPQALSFPLLLRELSCWSSKGAPVRSSILDSKCLTDNFCFREQLSWHPRAVTLIMNRMSLIVDIQGRWRNIEAAPPKLYLLFPVFLDSFELVESLQSSIVSFVKPPVFNDRNVVAIKLVGAVVEGLYSPSENGSETDIELIAILLQGTASLHGFVDACAINKHVPVEVSRTSVHPQNRFSLFHKLSP